MRLTHEDVIERICHAIRTGRDRAKDWSFPSDCFCRRGVRFREVAHYEYDGRFLSGLEAAITEYVASYRHGEE